MPISTCVHNSNGSSMADIAMVTGTSPVCLQLRSFWQEEVTPTLSCHHGVLTNNKMKRFQTFLVKNKHCQAGTENEQDDLTLKISLK